MSNLLTSSASFSNYSIALGCIKGTRLLKRIQIEILNFKNCRVTYDNNINNNFQQNNYDCGPMICGYAVNIILNEDLINITISYIRELTDHLMSTRSTLRMGGNQLIGRGLLKIVDIESEEYIYISDAHNVRFAHTLSRSRDFLKMDPSLSRAIATNDKTVIIEFLLFKLFKDRRMILCPYLFQKSKWVLIIVNLIKGTITALDTH